MAFDPISAAMEIGGKLIDRLWPNPEQAAEAKLKLLQMQQDGELARMTNDTEIFKAEVDDRKSARDREAQVAASADAPALSKLIVPVLAAGVLLLTFGLFYVVVFQSGAVDPSRKDIVIYVLGVLSAISTQVVSYYFGSSKGSVDKSSVLDHIAAGK